MSNVETAPEEVVCGGDAADGELVTPRDVPLGGPRAMTVRRTLPQRTRSLIGAWCFLDHYGPDRVADTGGMAVPGHPHTGLATVSWLFSGRVEHRDTTGAHAIVRPGELNLMTAGSGIAHSEFSTPTPRCCTGCSCGWRCPPPTGRPPPLRALRTAPGAGRDAALRVFLGSLAGSSSPVPTSTALLGAEVVLPAGASVTLDVDAGFEHGVLVDTGSAQVSGTAAATAELVYLPPGRTTLDLHAGDDGARLVLLGGEPLGEQIVMWWNFVGSTHDEVVAFREQWQDERAVGDGTVAASGCSRTPGTRRCRRRSCRTRG